MALLFSPLTIRNVTLENRIVVSPMCQYSAEEGKPTAWHQQHYGVMAASGPGLVVIEATGVLPEGRITHACLGLWSDAQEAAFTDLVRNMKSYGNSKVSIQLGHAGRKSSLTLLWEGSKPIIGEGGWPCYAPSALPYDSDYPVPVELDSIGMERVKNAFVASAKRCVSIGFDMIELHYAHGYLIHEFLSPITNKRTDRYGGSLENRMRFPLEVLAAVRAVWPEDKPLGIRVSATEWVQGESHDQTEATLFLKEAKKLGLDYVCVSSGGNVAHAKLPLDVSFQSPLAQEIRESTGLITRTVGLIVTGEQAEQALAEGRADFVAIGRAFLNDPRWVWHAAKELGVAISHAPQYKFTQPGFWRMSDVANPPRKTETK